MSSQPRGDRRDRSRSSSQTAQQRWIPRGSAPSSVSVNNNIPPATFNPSNVDGRGEQSNANPNSAPREARPKGAGNASRSYVAGRPVNNHRRDKQREKGETHAVKESVDPNLPQLVQEIREKLAKGTVECMICYDMVRRSAPIWSCSSCYSIFHLHCIKKWVRAPTSIDMSADKHQGFNWRCPGCQYVQLTPLKEISYLCFCGKRTDPPSDLYLTPHSCGEPCGKPLERHLPGSLETKEDSCPHNCVLQCHPGPCPPCKSFAPPCLCPCGKKTITTRCSDRQSVLTCGQQCDKLLDCQRHCCGRMCHVGPCDPCEILVTASCFCKKKQEVVSCGDMSVKGEVNVKDGVFSCNSSCGKLLACGNHECDEVCHPGPCGSCALMPGRVKSCYCGKTSLQKERKSCLDPIPNCSQVCSKLLPCGIHNCEDLCHSGDCAPCMVSVSQKCQCGSTSRTVACYQTSTESEKFKCDKPCGRKKNCGRHRCSERCCPLSNPNPVRSEDWDPHFCQMACGKKLRCGQHSCESLCHSGHCPPCLETIFSDLTCACGRTSIPPPLPCGTPAPSCQLPCSVSQPCGHLASHSCHYGDCPPCSVPVAKECVGGHVVLKNIPCGSKDIRCNKLCGKTRQCGLHACGRTCHPAPCDSSGSTSAGAARVSCGQTCGAPRRDCRHTCAALCHPSSPCPDVRCQFPVTISCSCGRITASVPCDAGGTNAGYSADTVFDASIAHKLPAPLQPVESTGSRIPLGQRKLTCDEECAKSERKRVLADAFDISTPNFEALHFGENSQVTELIADLYRRDPKWVLAVEERCKYLVLGKSKGTVGGLKVHVFCPMMKDKRDAVRLIAERWKLSINVAGWEPKRFVVLHATPKSRPPSRVICVKGTTTNPHSPTFDPLVDMDPRLVVSFLDLPREADVSSLVLRFGGECELIWLNDKNALAVFSDPARAATALRRLDHASAYYGVAVVLQNTGPGGAWGAMGTPAREGGGVSATLKGASAWKKAVTQVDSWGGEEQRHVSSMDAQSTPWKQKEAAVNASVNRWSVLDLESSSSNGASLIRSNNQGGSHSGSGAGASLLPRDAVVPDGESSEVVDDWEKAYDMENDVQ